MFKNNKNLEIKIGELIENFKNSEKSYQEMYNQIRENDQNFMYSLLEEKSQLEKEIAKEIAKREAAEKRLEKILSKSGEVVREYEKIISELNAEIGVQKGKYELSSKSKGSLQKKIDNLINKTKEQEVYIMYLVKELEKSKRKVPSLKKVLTYEYKRCSNRIEEIKKEEVSCR